MALRACRHTSQAACPGPHTPPRCARPRPPPHTHTHTQSHGPGSHWHLHMARHQQNPTNTAHSHPLTAPMSRQHLHTRAPTHQHSPAAFIHTPRPHSRGLSPTQTEELGDKHPNFTPAGPPPLAPPQGRKRPRAEAVWDRQVIESVRDGGEETVRDTVLVRAAELWGTGRCPWWGKTTRAMQMWGKAGPGALEVEK